MTCNYITVEAETTLAPDAILARSLDTVVYPADGKMSDES